MSVQNIIPNWENRYKALFEHPEEGVFITNQDGIILDINSTYQRITGYKKEEILGNSPNILKSNRHDKLFYEQMWNSLKEHGFWAGMIYNKRKDGSIYLEKLNIKTVHDEGGFKNYIAHFTDLTDSESSKKTLYDLARYDTLTGLITREVFNVRLNRAIARNGEYNRKFSVLLLDLDNFKDINNSYGESYGNEVLKEVSLRLKENVRIHDTLARYGGDEFVIILENNEGIKALEDFGQNILDKISLPIKVEDKEFILTSSLGVTTFPEDGLEAKELMKNVHVVTQQSKQKDLNCLTFYNKTMTDDVKDKLSLIHDLHLALQREEFELYYQPLVGTIEQNVMGVEALIRWNHPQKGLLFPLEFISLAEETHQIIALGEWVLKNACIQLQRWHQSGEFMGFISVNISGIQLLKSDFSKKVKEILELTQVDPTKIELEITETQMMDHLDDVIKTLEEIRKFGVRISIDDFGTGYSSLGHLRKLPINKLKIDKQFIKELHNSKDDKEISKAIIGMAKALNLDVLAEGIEEKEQLHYLLAQGCEVAQGYYFSEPLTKKEFSKFICTKK